MDRKDKTNYFINTVSNALNLLNLLSDLGGEAGVTELANGLGLHKNNIFRLLATLEHHGFVEQNQLNDNYSLGAANLKIAQSYLINSDIIQKANFWLTNLNENINESISLVKLVGDTTYYPIHIDSQMSVRVASRVGYKIASRDTLTGRLLSANATKANDEFKKYSGKDSAMDNGDLENEVFTFSYLLKGMGQKILGAVEVRAPLYRAEKDLIIQHSTKIANKISSYFADQITSLENKVMVDISKEGKDVAKNF